MNNPTSTESQSNPAGRSNGTASSWKLADRTIVFGNGPLLMGIVNVTPDSFSDGGKWAQTDAAVENGLRLVNDGAAILDIGGESTRPYCEPVSCDEELTRVIPVIGQLAKRTCVPISIDTSKADVAQAAIDAGASIINDITGLTGDPGMISVAVRTGAGICAMHMQGTPQTMQEDPQYENVVEEILAWLKSRRRKLIEAGIESDRICLDPGIGFGKTHEHNLQLLKSIERFHETGAPLLVGHSRKGFIGKLTGPELEARDAGTLGISLHLALCGVQIIRLHEVAATRNALQTMLAVRDVAKPFAYDWPRPAMAVDLVVLRPSSAGQEILLIQRKRDPFVNCWALPGGFVEPDETVAQASLRELNEETGVVGANPIEIGTWSRPDRDPRGRVISVCFWMEVASTTQAIAGDDAKSARWHSLNKLPRLAFDHAEMIAAAMNR